MVKVQIIYGTCKKRGQVLPAIMLSPSGYCEQCLRKLQHERASEEEEGTMDLLAESEVMESEEDLVDEEH